MGEIQAAPPPEPPVQRSPFRAALLFCIAFFLCAEASTLVSVSGLHYMSFWLPAGLYLAVLLLNPTRSWPWLVMAALPAGLAFDLLRHHTIAVSLGFNAANAVTAVMGAYLVRRFVAERPNLATLEQFIGIVVFAALLSTLPGAAIGASTLVLAGLSHSFAESCRIWWGSITLTTLTLSPLLLSFCAIPGFRLRGWGRPKKILEPVLLSLFALAICWMVLVRGRGIFSPNRIWLFLPIMWATLRFGVRGAAVFNLFLILAVAFFTTHVQAGLTPADVASGDYAFGLQTVLAVASVLGLIPAIVLNERDNSLDRLRASEERYRNLVQQAADGIFVVDSDGVYLEVNEVGARMMGMTAAEIVGRRIRDLVVPEDIPTLEADFATVRAGATILRERRFRRKDGSVFVAEVCGRRLLDGRIQGIVRDVTQRKRVEEALRQSEERFRGLNSATFEGICVNEGGKILDVNEQFGAIVGYEREELIGRDVLSLIAPAYRAVVSDRLRAGPTTPLEHKVLRKDGATVDVEAQSKVITWRGRIVRVTAVRDITERKQAEAELLDAARREQDAHKEFTRSLLASQEQERSRIAAELHDSLGQHLLLVKNHAHLALTRGEPAPEPRRQLEAIDRLAELSIDEVRHIAHDLRPYQIDHLGLTHAIAAMIDKAAESTGMVFTQQLDSVDDVFAPEMAIHLYRIVQECLNNILKHAGAKQVTVQLDRDIRDVRFEIRDDGRGFELNPAHPSAVTAVPTAPAGLGLKNLAERARILKGTLDVQSQPGQGTRVTVVIPIPGDIN